MAYDKDSWDAGFRAGYYTEPLGNDFGFEKESFASGYAEGKAKHDGVPSHYYIDAIGQVKRHVDLGGDKLSPRFIS